MIIGIVGNMGAGKTITSVVLGEYFASKADGANVVSNFHCKPADKVVTNPNELEELSRRLNGIQILDEIWAWADSRKSGQNELFNEMVINSRKRGWIIIYTAQDFHMVDKRLRDNTDYAVLPEHKSSPQGDTASFTIIDKVNRTVVSRHSYDPERFYDHYDTTEEVGTKTKSDQYDGAIETAKDMWRANPDANKVDIVSELVLEEDVSKTDADLISTKAKNDINLDED